MSIYVIFHGPTSVVVSHPRFQRPPNVLYLTNLRNLESKIEKTSYHSWKNNEIHMFLAKSWFSLAKKCEKDLKIQFFKLNCITFITKLSQCTFLFSKVETFKFKSWIYACWANSWIRVTVEPKPGRPYPSDWQPQCSQASSSQFFTGKHNKV